MSTGDRHREGTLFAFTETIPGTNRLWYPCVKCGLQTTARENQPEPMCQTCLMHYHGAHPNIKAEKKKYTRLPGDTTPLRVPGVLPLAHTYVPDPEPVIRPPVVPRRSATPEELGRGARIVYSAAIRHGWLVDITYAHGYLPDEEVAVESHALRMVRSGTNGQGDRRAVAVWEDGSVSSCYYWEGNAQPSVVTTTDLIGQRKTEHRAFKEALLDVGWSDDRRSGGVPATPRIPRQRKAERPDVGTPGTWYGLEVGDTIADKDGNPWVVREVTYHRDGKRGMTVSKPDHSQSFTRPAINDGPVKVLRSAEEQATDALASVFDVDTPGPTIPTGQWLSELQIEECRQRGTGCGHEVCRWARQKRRRQRSE